MMVEPDSTMAAKYGVIEYHDLDEALEKGPDAVFITNPSGLHIPVAIMAARAGCHLFIEKPLSDTAEGLDELMAIVESKGLAAMVGYQFRFHPGLREAKKQLDAGSIGRVILASAQIGEYLPGWHPYEDYREGYAARRDLGGGALATQSHEFDYLLWLLGMPTKIYASGGHLSRLELDVEDTVSIQMTCGVEGREVPVSLQLDYLQWPPVRGCTIVGDEGKITIDLIANQAMLYQRPDGKTTPFQSEVIDRNQLFVDELNHFLACMRGESMPPVSLSEAKQNVQMLAAARQSMETGKAVDI